MLRRRSPQYSSDTARQSNHSDRAVTILKWAAYYITSRHPLSVQQAIEPTSYFTDLGPAVAQWLERFQVGPQWSSGQRTLKGRSGVRSGSPLASHQGDPSSISDRVTGFSHVGIVLDDAVDWVMTVGKLSPYINVDSEHEVTRKLSMEALHQELQYAHHLGMPAVMLTLHGPRRVNLARILYNKLQAGCVYQIWLHLRLETMATSVHHYYSSEGSIDSSKTVVREDTWEW
ncbi:hypothetical protein PR048_000871 [Dryococelus australis]|uniref:PRMT5 TIM barrel domain-containing protein n=1 Tax=Dryococelus australis TaxID=614101 RepID=A0ABQ9IFU2_9NEOP|nr:hypothetical protein PR048_000871 [Dryococelus australis]